MGRGIGMWMCGLRRWGGGSANLGWPTMWSANSGDLWGFTGTVTSVTLSRECEGGSEWRTVNVNVNVLGQGIMVFERYDWLYGVWIRRG
jgi:hypothetical protein